MKRSPLSCPAPLCNSINPGSPIEPDTDVRANLSTTHENMIRRSSSTAAILRKCVLAFYFLATFTSTIGAQNRETDSLLSLLQVAKEDSNKVNLLNDLSKLTRSDSVDLAMVYSTQAQALAVKINYQRGLANSYKNIGICCYVKGKNVEALQYWDLAEQVYTSLGDKIGVSNMLNNKGAVYFNQSDDSKALELYLSSLQLAEEAGDTLRIVTALGNVGAVYSNKRITHTLALQNYLRALPLCEAIEDSYTLGLLTSNIGDVYYKQGNDSTAKLYFIKSAQTFEDTWDMCYPLNYLGKIYKRQGDYDTALIYHSRAYEIAKANDSDLDMVQSKIGIANVYLGKRDYDEAAKNFLLAEEIAIPIHALDELKEIYGGLASVYYQSQDFANAYTYQVKLIAVKDSIYNIDTDKKLQGLQFNFDLNKKQAEVDLLVKDNEISEKVIERQKLVRNGFIGGFVVVLIFAGIFFRQRIRIAKEKKISDVERKRSDELLLNILPEEVAEELKAKGSAEAQLIDEVTVLFTDFKGFTAISEKLSPKELVKDLNECFSAFDHIMEKYGMEKIKTIGDSYMAAGGLPTPNRTHAEDAVKAAMEIREFIESGKADKLAKGEPFFEIRIGIHTGPVVAGIVGVKKFAYDIWGDTVNTASRMESSGEVGQVNISETTYALVKDKFNCVSRGKIVAKGKGEIEMYFVLSRIIQKCNPEK